MEQQEEEQALSVSSDTELSQSPHRVRFSLFWKIPLRFVSGGFMIRGFKAAALWVMNDLKFLRKIVTLRPTLAVEVVVLGLVSYILFSLVLLPLMGTSTKAVPNSEQPEATYSISSLKNQKALRGSEYKSYLVIMEELQLSQVYAKPDETIEARFTIANIGNAPIAIDAIRAGGRLGQTWEDEHADFPPTRNFTLQPGEQCSYLAQRTFEKSGNYFAEVVIQINGKWGGLANLEDKYPRIWFDVA